MVNGKETSNQHVPFEWPTLRERQWMIHQNFVQLKIPMDFLVLNITNNFLVQSHDSNYVPVLFSNFLLSECTYLRTKIYR